MASAALDSLSASLASSSSSAAAAAAAPLSLSLSSRENRRRLLILAMGLALLFASSFVAIRHRIGSSSSSSSSDSLLKSRRRTPNANLHQLDENADSDLTSELTYTQALLGAHPGVVEEDRQKAQADADAADRRNSKSRAPAAPKMRAPSPVERPRDNGTAADNDADVDSAFEAKEARDISIQKRMQEWCARRGRDACRFPPPPQPAAPAMLRAHAELVNGILNATGIHTSRQGGRHDDGTDGQGNLVGTRSRPIYSKTTAFDGGKISGARTGLRRVRVIGDYCSGVAQAVELLRYMLDPSMDVRGGLFRPAGAFQDPDATPADVGLERGGKWDPVLGEFEPLTVDELKDTLVVVVVQNVYDWLWCMYTRGLEHDAHRKMAFDLFYGTKWAPVAVNNLVEVLQGNETCVHGYSAFQVVPCNDPFGTQAYEMNARNKGRQIQPFESILELRKAKLENHIVQLQRLTRNHIILRSEDMIRYTKMQEFLTQLTHRFAIKLPYGSLLPATSKDGPGNDNFPPEVAQNVTTVLQTPQSRFFLFPNNELDAVHSFLRDYEKNMKQNFALASKHGRGNNAFCLQMNAWKSPQCLEMGVGKKARESFPFHIRANMVEIHRKIDQAMENLAGYHMCEIRDTNVTGAYKTDENGDTITTPTGLEGYDSFLVEDLCCEDCLANTVDVERNPLGYMRSMAFIRRHAPRAIEAHMSRLRENSNVG